MAAKPLVLQLPSSEKKSIKYTSKKAFPQLLRRDLIIHDMYCSHSLWHIEGKIVTLLLSLKAMKHDVPINSYNQFHDYWT
jgi:hypothetical protein